MGVQWGKLIKQKGKLTIPLGIPRELRDKIFDRFYRVTDSKQQAAHGLGMGLYIVAEIVKGHGGTITVDSAVGKDSTFTVTLPLTRDA